METEELWLPVTDWEGVYEVSNFGNVRRVLEGKGTRGPNHVLKPGTEKGGYLHVNLHYNGVRKIAKVHALILGAFVGPRPKKSEINHKDGDTANNRVSNLEYCSVSENKLHSYAVLQRLRKGAKGMANAKAKLTDEQVSEIRHRYSLGGVSQQKLADEFGVNQTMVGFIVRRVSWSHVN